jgi:hypothetical protein
LAPDSPPGTVCPPPPGTPTSDNHCKNGAFGRRSALPPTVPSMSPLCL